MTTTDPGSRAGFLRRLIPPLRIFGISIDLSLWLLLLATWVLRSVCLNLVN